MTSLKSALGRWPNAPLALVCAQIRFDPHADRAPEQVKARIRNATGPDCYPLVNPVRPMSVIIGQALPVPMPAPIGLDLHNEQKTEVIRLQSDSLTFLSAAYRDSALFMGQWRTFIGALCEDRELPVTRLGLRYVDFIIPSNGNTPENYFRGDLGRSPNILGEQSPIAFNLYDYPRPAGGHLRLQYSRGYGPPMLPADLQGSVLLPSRFAMPPADGLSAVLDMDRWQPMNRPLTTVGIVDETDRLRSDMSETFRCILSPLAVREWAAESGGTRA